MPTIDLRRVTPHLSDRLAAPPDGPGQPDLDLQSLTISSDGAIGWARAGSSLGPETVRWRFLLLLGRLTTGSGRKCRLAYDLAQIQAGMKAIFGTSSCSLGLSAYLFADDKMPLAVLPYHASLAAWLLTTFAAYLWVIRRIARHWLALVAAVMFAGAIANFGYGQNGFLVHCSSGRRPAAA